MAEVPVEYRQFMPMGMVRHQWTPNPVINTSKPPAKKPAPPADPEKSPERQLARRLGDYGADILRDSIKVDYRNQHKKWSRNISLVATAFSLALGQQASKMKKDEQKRRAKAELAAFLFSLVTAGIMRWAGTFVQYKTYPKLFSTMNEKTMNVRVPGALVFPKVIESDYNKHMAAFVGGIVQDVGNVTLSYVTQRQSGDPFLGLAPDDTASLVRVTEQSLSDALEDGMGVVVDQIEKAVFWMEQSPDFGEAWSKQAKGNESEARRMIKLKLEAVRDEWARTWPVYGQDPKPVNQAVLSNAIERVLWAAFADGHFTAAFEYLGKYQGVGPYSFEDVMSKRMDRNQNYFSSSLGVGETIIDRLKQLNIVDAETAQGMLLQQNRRQTEGAPKPNVAIDTEVDSFDEVRKLWRWARDYPQDVSTMTRHAGVEGVPRGLPAIPAY